MFPLSRPIRLLVLAVSLGVLVSAIAAGAMSIGLPLVMPGEQPRWATFGFEAVCVVAAVLGVLTGMGRFSVGPAMALTCIAGTILVASGLGWQAAGRQMGGVPLWPLLLGRVAAAAVLALAGAWAVLRRRRGALATAVRGGLLVAPVAIAAGAILHPVGRRLIGGAIGASPAIQFLAVTVGFLAATALLAAGGHLLIRAFEMGRPAESGGTTSRPPPA